MNTDKSILFTTHSPHITAITPLEFIVHISKKNKISSEIHALQNLDITSTEYQDLMRYIDVKRGEIYFGKGVILVEGIAEEYLIPIFSELLDIPLDKYGVIICNINSTNFYPYIKFLNALNIPTVTITDGDFYYLNPDETKDFNSLENAEDARQSSYLGLENFKIILDKLSIKYPENISNGKLFDFAKQKYYFMGSNTLEIDIMANSHGNLNATKKLIDAYNAVSLGGKTQKSNFSKELNNKEYFKCLNKITVTGVGKGRFAQRLSHDCVDANIPKYIENGIRKIIELVQ